MRRVEHTPLLGASAEAHSEMVVDLNEALRPTKNMAFVTSLLKSELTVTPIVGQPDMLILNRE